MRNGQRQGQRHLEDAQVFERLYERVDNLLERFGRPNFTVEHPYGDFTVHGDYGGFPQVVVFASSLEMLRPPVVVALQQIAKEYPGWEIVVTVALWHHMGDWPHMGLYIRGNEIIDGLQRQYFPKEFQNLEYREAEGARPGTELDSICIQLRQREANEMSNSTHEEVPKAKSQQST